MQACNILSTIVIGSLLTSGFVSCESNDLQEESTLIEDDGQLHSCAVKLNITKEEYSDVSKVRSADEWTSGDKIYLTFYVASGQTYGEAVYDGVTWTLNYYGVLQEGTIDRCTAVYFEDAVSCSNTLVTLNQNSAIYEDANGQYAFKDGALAVSASLSPKLGRIRFSGENDTKFSVLGITYCTSYDFSTMKCGIASTAITSQIDSTGYSSYIYGSFTNDTVPRLNVITAESGFSCNLSPTIYQKGQSGYMKLPTMADFSGWRNAVVIELNGVDLTMLPVEYSYGNFLLAETELTRELYKAVLQSTSYTTEMQHPASLSSSGADSFISAVIGMTGLTLRYPSRSEWEFAAKGGKKTQGYTYSGSNTLAEVGWYVDNSENSTHAVKQLLPNELGFYDMSGNISERTSYYTAYSVYGWGGAYDGAASACTPTSYTSVSYCGLRIALSCNN